MGHGPDADYPQRRYRKAPLVGGFSSGTGNPLAHAVNRYRINRKHSYRVIRGPDA